jgi:uracil-DNA glycosylase family 4
MRLADLEQPAEASSALLVIGEAPGFHEDQQGKSWVGRAGQMLHDMLNLSKLSELGHVYLTNAVKCRPGQNETPGKKIQKACFPLLAQDIAQLCGEYQRVTLLLAGATACSSVLNSSLTAALNNQGQFFSVKVGEGQVAKLRVFATYHPAYVLRQPSTINVVRDHLLLVHRVLSGQMREFEDIAYDFGGKHPKAPHEVKEGLLSLDIETYGALKGVDQTAFHPRKMVAVDGRDPEKLIETVALSWWDPDGAEHSTVYNWHRPEHRRRLHEFLSWGANSNLVLLGQNIQFDLQVLRFSSPALRTGSLKPFGMRLEDCMMWNYLHNELRPERSLKSIAKLFNLAKYKKQNFEASGPEDPELLTYNVLDTLVSLRARQLLVSAIRQDYGEGTAKLSEVCREHASNLLWTAIYLSESGVPYSIPALERMETDLKFKMQCLDVEAEAFEWPINEPLILHGKGSKNSIQALVELGVGVAGVESNPDLVLTDKKKEISTKEENLHLIENNLPPESRDEPSELVAVRGGLDMLSRFRKAQKMLTSYVHPLLHLPNKGIVDRHGDVGIVYPTWYPFPSKHELEDSVGGTVQARMTAKYPGVQTAPRAIKACETSRFVRGIILDSDYSQIELRVAGLLSGDEPLLQAYAEGIDLHVQSGDILMWACTGCPKGQLWSIFEERGKKHEDVALWRQMGKTTNFLVVFEGKAFKLVHTVRGDTGYELPVESAEAFIREYDKLHWKLREYQAGLVRTVKEEGFLELPFGWSRTFLGTEVDVENEKATIVNMPVQATAAAILQSAQAQIIRELERRRMKSKLDKNVYDSIRIDCPPWEVPAVHDILSRHLTNPPLFEYLCKELGRTVPLEYETKEIPQ